MSLKMINPFDINDSIMTSSIAEPDLTQGEEEWVDVNGTSIDLDSLSDYFTAAYNSYSSAYINSGGDIYYAVFVSQNPESTNNIYIYNADGVLYNTINSIDNPYITADPQCVCSYDAANNTESGSFICMYKTGYITFNIDGGVEQVAGGLATTSSINDCCYYDNSLVAIIAYATSDQSNDRFTIRTFIYGSSSYSDEEYDYPDGASGAYFSSQFGQIALESGYFYIAQQGGSHIYKYDSEFASYSLISSDIGSDNYGYSRGIDITPDGFLFSTYNRKTYGYLRSTSLVDRNFKIVAPYRTGDQVILTETHKLYQCASDEDFYPPDIGAALTPPTWVEVSATNKYKAFDYVINTKSVMDSATAELTFSPLQATTNIALFGLENVTRVYIEVREDNASGTVIYNEHLDLAIASPIDDFIANETLLGDKAIFDDLPVYEAPFITVTFDSDEDKISVGDVVIGNSRTLGVTTYQSSTSRTSYDTVDTDDFGNESITSRPSAEYTSFEVVVFPEYANYVERILKDSLNKPRVWVGDKPNDEKIFTFGYYERSPITYSSPAQYETTLKVRGLV